MATTKLRKIRLLTLSVASFATLSACLTLLAQTQDLPIGKVIERVVCLKDASQSYALYLPPDYTPDRRWPVIYAFDPGGRGVRPVERFKDAAVKYGHIIIGSNNSRNGPGVPLSAILSALFDDTQARFSIDANRVYTTGFSGGARVAALVAQSLEGRIAGVILCGAGFSQGKVPAKPLSFPVFGVAGSEDFNWAELRQLNRALDSIEIRPDNPQVFFALARACAMGGEKRQALEALKKAVELGFTNADEIVGNPDFASIRNEAAYKQLAEDAKRKAQSGRR